MRSGLGIRPINGIPLDVRTAALTSLAMVCFAANSLLCRLALAPQRIDAASFTTVRVLSASAMLVAIFAVSRRSLPSVSAGNWRQTASLFAYLVFFSFAYTRLSAGTGALLLFGAVQLTMFIAALRHGERFPMLSWAGLGLAVLGLLYLLLPGATAPDPLGAVFMIIAGTAWGLLSLLARGGRDPLAANLANFATCIPLVIAVSLALSGEFHVTAAGLSLAVASGAVASGLGYVIWYAALRGLARTHAATVQLAVPAIAAFGGVILLAEPVTTRLVVASCALLGGVAVVISRRA